MIANIRTISQQLTCPTFDRPLELVQWMGAIQAQDYSMSKWAVGLRLKSATLQKVEQALAQGEILRTHVMRPTWHLVAAEDIRWMLNLKVKSLKKTFENYAKVGGLVITPKQYDQYKSLLIRVLEGNKSLTRQEIEVEFIKAGIIQPNNEADKYRVKYTVALSEVEGIICNGIDKGTKATYALLDERVPPTRELLKEEALTLLAKRYFRSHSPASLNDFTWWSGLTITEARQAISLITPELITGHFADQKLFVHETYKETPPPHGDTLHLLPAFDEYLISYKDRTIVIDREHIPKAFNKNGTFYPVILHKGKIVGNWNKSVKKGQLTIETSFFDPTVHISSKEIERAENHYKNFFR